MKNTLILCLLMLVCGCGLHMRQNVVIDPMTGEKYATFSVNASVEKRYGAFKIIGLYFSVSQINSTVCVLGHDFPGKQARIRIDGGEPITMGEKGCMKLSPSLSRRFSGAKTVRVQGYVFPSDIPLTGDADMGFYTNKIRWARSQVGIKQTNTSRYPTYSDEELSLDYYKN